MNNVDFTVKLTGSKLFDLNTYVTAQKLCARFPGLHYDYSDKNEIHIFGELNDYWYNEYNKAMFELGRLE